MKRNTWTINRLSPVFNLDCQEVTLKRYAAKIKQALARTTHDLDNNLIISSKFTEISTTDDDKTNFKTIQVGFLLFFGVFKCV